MTLRAHPLPERSGLGRAVLSAVGVLLAAFIACGGAATAAPGPPPGQLQARLSKLMSQLDALAQHYDQSISELTAARARLALVDREVSRKQASFAALRAAMARFASAAYEQGDTTSAAALLSSDNAQAVLGRASLLTHLSRDREAQMGAFIAAAWSLRASRQAQRRTTMALMQRKQRMAAQRSRLKQLIAKDQAELNRLTAPAAPGLASRAVTYAGPASGTARTAISLALAQVGKPYVWGAAGPDAYDCSGLVQAAWAAAGVPVPRTTYQQWAALPHVPASSIQPGDLAFFDGEGHVAIYIGNGHYVDAPQPGQNVEVVPMSESWYAGNLDGYVRP